MNILIIGATSTIAQRVIRRFANDAASICLVGHDPLALTSVASDAQVRGATILRTDTFDATDLDDIIRCIERVRSWNIAFDIVLISHGLLGNTRADERDLLRARDVLNVNGTSACLFALGLADILERQGHGSLAIVSSVAGLRGRASNYIYGSAKAAVDVLLQGLRQRFNGTRIRVITILPGMVDTAMTAHLPKTRLFANPERVAEDIYQGLVHPKRSVIYTPRYWRWIMAIIVHIPEALFIKLSF